MSYAIIVPLAGASYNAYAAQSTYAYGQSSVPALGGYPQYAQPALGGFPQYAQPAFGGAVNPYAAAVPSNPFIGSTALPVPYGSFAQPVPAGYDPLAALYGANPLAGLAAPSFGFPAMGLGSGVSAMPYNPLTAGASSGFGSGISASSLLPFNPLSALTGAANNTATATPASAFSSLFAPQAAPVQAAPAADPMASMLPMMMMMMMGGKGSSDSMLPLMMMMMGMGGAGATGATGSTDPMASMLPMLMQLLAGGGSSDPFGLGASAYGSDPFATDNFLSQTAALPTFSGSSTGTVAGDPHFTDITNTKGGIDFDVMGAAGKNYNIISDKNIQFNSQFIPWKGNAGATVNGKAAMKLKTDDGKELKVLFDPAKGGPEVDGVVLKAGESKKFKMNGKDASVEFKGGNMIVTTDEYVITAENKGTHLDYSVKTQKDGVLTDRVTPHGLLGQTADGDTNIRVGKKGQGAQGEGAIDFKVNDYEVKDLFDDPKALINRFGIKTRTVTDAKGKATRLFDQNNTLLATLDKDGNMVSVRRNYDAKGNIVITLADGKTKVDESGKIIESEAPAK